MGTLSAPNGKITVGTSAWALSLLPSLFPVPTLARKISFSRLVSQVRHGKSTPGTPISSLKRG